MNVRVAAAVSCGLVTTAFAAHNSACQTVDAAWPFRSTSIFGASVNGALTNAAQGTLSLSRTSGAVDPRVAISGGLSASRFGVQPVGEAQLRIADVFTGIHVSIGVERTTILGASADRSVRPFVLVGTRSTPATPHDTLTPQQAEARVSASQRPSLRAVIAPVLSIQSQSRMVQWTVTASSPHSGCCARVAGMPTAPAIWLDGDAIVGVAPHVGVRLSAGSYRHLAATTLANGKPYAQLGIAIGTFEHFHHQTAPDSSDALSYVFQIAGIDSTDMNGGVRHVRLRVWSARASNVAVRGDFSDWRATALSPAGEGIWEASITMNAGLHTLSLTLDGSVWRRPPTLPGSSDFAPSTGLLVVP